LAHHYHQALGLIRALGGSDTALEARTRTALREAGDRALVLCAYPAAVRHFQAALELWPIDDRERARVLFALGTAWFYAEQSLPSALVEARDTLVSDGDLERAGEAEFMLAAYFAETGDAARGRRHIDHAVHLLDGTPASAAKARVLCHLGCVLVLEDRDYERGVSVSRDAARITDSLHLAEVGANAHLWIGTGELLQGRREGVRHLWESIALASETKSADALPPYLNTSEWLSWLGDLEAARRLAQEGLHRAKGLGRGTWVQAADAAQLPHLYWAGRWDQASQQADLLLSEISDAGPSTHEALVRTIRGLIRRGSGFAPAAATDFARAAEWARQVARPETIILALPFHATSLLRGGRPTEAHQVMQEFIQVWQGDLWSQWVLAEAAYAATALDLKAEFLASSRKARLPTPWLDAATAILDADHRRAADVLGDIGSLPDQATAHLQAARQLIQEYRADGEAQLQKALAFWQRVGATAYIREAEALLARAESA
jgi:tetratricopeptide (TPR) repeat protein